MLITACRSSGFRIDLLTVPSRSLNSGILRLSSPVTAAGPRRFFTVFPFNRLPKVSPESPCALPDDRMFAFRQLLRPMGRLRSGLLQWQGRQSQVLFLLNAGAQWAGAFVQSQARCTLCQVAWGGKRSGLWPAPPFLKGGWGGISGGQAYLCFSIIKSRGCVGEENPPKSPFKKGDFSAVPRTSL